MKTSNAVALSIGSFIGVTLSAWHYGTEPRVAIAMAFGISIGFAMARVFS
jgi:EamA domain-containing membrane protein RarD